MKLATISKDEYLRIKELLKGSGMRARGRGPRMGKYQSDLPINLAERVAIYVNKPIIQVDNGLISLREQYISVDEIPRLIKQLYLCYLVM